MKMGGRRANSLVGLVTLLGVKPGTGRGKLKGLPGTGNEGRRKEKTSRVQRPPIEGRRDSQLKKEWGRGGGGFINGRGSTEKETFSRKRRPQREERGETAKNNSQRVENAQKRGAKIPLSLNDFGRERLGGKKSLVV